MGDLYNRLTTWMVDARESEDIVDALPELDDLADDVEAIEDTNEELNDHVTELTDVIKLADELLKDVDELVRQVVLVAGYQSVSQRISEVREGIRRVVEG